MENQQTVQTKQKNCPRLSRLTGLLYATVAAIFAAVASLLTKYTTTAEASQFVLFRCIVQYLFLLPVITYRRTSVIGDKSSLLKFILMRGACGSFALTLLFVAIQRLPLGDAVAISYTYSVLVGFFACLCLKETCSVFQIIFTLLTAVGVLFIAQPPAIFGNTDAALQDNMKYPERVIGIIAAICSAILNSVTYVIVRKMGSEVHFTISMFYYAWEGAVISLIYLAAAGNLEIPTLSDFPYITGVAVFGLIAQIFMTIALQKEKAGPVTLVQTTQIIFAFLFQWAFLGNTPSLYSGIGGFMIFCSSFGVTLYKFWTAAPKSGDTASDLLTVIEQERTT
uniref:solute carrier family 35 member G1-like n=1 Tax=Ciona intestinalis TaxID=7719 RepID=UPI00089DAF8C|nr:solute carrier family 35 member G1-like [Ciona intestinalis]|eukprot:XP_009861270.2 solute carrier family 35 member G1-like [Ciona intestinalis]